MYKITKSLEERLIPVKELTNEFGHRWEDYSIAHADFQLDYVSLTIINIHFWKEAHIDLTPEEFTDYADDFLPKNEVVKNTGYTYARAYANLGRAGKILNRVKEAILYMVHPEYEEIEQLERIESNYSQLVFA